MLILQLLIEKKMEWLTLDYKVKVINTINGQPLSVKSWTEIRCILFSSDSTLLSARHDIFQKRFKRFFFCHLTLVVMDMRLNMYKRVIKIFISQLRGLFLKLFAFNIFTSEESVSLFNTTFFDGCLTNWFSEKINQVFFLNRYIISRKQPYVCISVVTAYMWKHLSLGWGVLDLLCLRVDGCMMVHLCAVIWWVLWKSLRTHADYVYR